MLLRLIPCLMLIFSFTILSSAQKKPEVVAQLTFHLWVQESPQGIQATGTGKKQNRTQHKGSFYLKSGENFQKVRYRQGRRTSEITYQGGKECVLYKKGSAEQSHEEVCNLSIPKSGKYMVILKTAGDVKNPVFSPILIPHGAKALKTGYVLFINYTDRRLGLILDADMKLSLLPDTMRSLPVSKSRAGGHHLEIHTQANSEGGWEVSHSKGYAIEKNSKSVCILYQDKEGGPALVKLFSGLE